MKISIAIMGHPKRQPEIDKLFAILAPMPFERVVQIIDRNNDEWTTGKRALRAGLDIYIADWHVVIQDDAILTPYFYENLESAIKSVPERSLISLYIGTARPLSDRVSTAVNKAQCGSWLAFHQLLWGVGIAIPTDHVLPMLEFVDDIKLQYDNRIGEFYARQGLLVYYTMPSLIDHDDDLGTLLPGHGKDINEERRVAHRLAAQHIPWTSDTTYI